MNNVPYRSFFMRFVLYNLIFVTLQFFFVFFKSRSFIHTLPLPSSVYIELVATLALHLFLYLILSLLQTALLWGLLQQEKSASRLAHEYSHVILWWLSTCALLTTNAYFFPLSMFSRIFPPELPRIVLELVMLLSVVALCLLTLNTLYFLYIRHRKSTVLAAILCASLSLYSMDIPLSKAMHSRKATVVLIGVDSLPPHAINRHHTPTLAGFINKSVYFKETISPLARTYPAWTGILTGLYPEHSHAHYNLMPHDMITSAQSIAWDLTNAGYETIFATDDRRFNSMGSEFGFQKIIGPKLGVNDFILGAFNDYPLSNLLINLPISRWLFPYNHINRASHFSYYPHSFDNALRHALASRQTDTPLFIAVHFTLPHWPYAFASSMPADVNNEYSVTEREQLYLAALQQVDKQVAFFLQALQQQGYLDNSLVALLSDHGETLYSPGSRKTLVATYQGGGSNKLADYFKRKTSTTLERSAGHGSDLLSPSQYHCVLAFQLFKDSQRINAHKAITARVALIDIAPTIRDFVPLPPNKPTDGISLLHAIIDPQAFLPERAFIMESGMLPNQFITREKARLIGSLYFTVNNTGQLQLKKNQIKTLNAMKLYAIIKGEWLLALYPDNLGYIPIVQRITDGAWVDNLSADFAQSSPARDLLDRLQRFYRRTWAVES